MRIDVIYGFPVVLEAFHAVSDHVLRYPDLPASLRAEHIDKDPTSGDEDVEVLSHETVFGAVLLARIDNAQPTDVIAFDVLNRAIDDASDVIATFDEWLANTPAGQTLQHAGGLAHPNVLVVVGTPSSSH